MPDPVVTPPANTPPPAQTPPPANTPPPSSADWTTGFNDETKGFVQNKGFKGPGDVIESYRNLEKLVGAKEKVLQLPESWESPEAQLVWEKLGKPKTAKDYNLPVPEKGGDPKLAEWAADIFHKGNLTTTQAQSVQKAWNERQAQVAAQTLENQKAAQTLADTELKQEWGMAYEKNRNLVDQAARNIGIDQNQIAALAASLGPKNAALLLHKLGTATGEASFVTGKPAGDGTVTPEQAKNQLSDLQRDKGWVTRYLSGDYDAKKQMEQLQKMANPGEVRLY